MPRLFAQRRSVNLYSSRTTLTCEQHMDVKWQLGIDDQVCQKTGQKYVSIVIELVKN